MAITVITLLVVVMGSLGATLAFGDTPALACPKVTIPDETREVTQFRSGGARDMTDVVSRAAVLQYDGGCEFDDAGVTVNLNLLLGAERGPAARDAQGAYQYFVAITDPAGRIIGKQQFDTTIAFSPNVGKGTSAEEGTSAVPDDVLQLRRGEAGLVEEPAQHRLHRRARSRGSEAPARSPPGTRR